MFDFLFRFVPPALAGGLALYGVATVLWLQPLVETRLAERHLIPACEAALTHAQTATPAPADQAQAGLDIGRRLLNDLGLGDLPGVEDTFETLEDLTQDMIPQAPRRSTFERDTICGCATETAFDHAGWAMTLHVASARTHTPPAITTLPHTVATIATSGQCGA